MLGVFREVLITASATAALASPCKRVTDSGLTWSTRFSIISILGHMLYNSTFGRIKRTRRRILDVTENVKASCLKKYQTSRPFSVLHETINVCGGFHSLADNGRFTPPSSGKLFVVSFGRKANPAVIQELLRPFFRPVRANNVMTSNSEIQSLPSFEEKAILKRCPRDLHHLVV